MARGRRVEWGGGPEGGGRGKRGNEERADHKFVISGNILHFFTRGWGRGRKRAIFMGDSFFASWQIIPFLHS